MLCSKCEYLIPECVNSEIEAPLTSFVLSLSDRPSNVLLKKLRPSVWFSIITALVGVAMLSQGLVKNNGQLIATRVILGIVEAGLYPGELS